MEGGADFTTTEILVVVGVGFGSALLGAIAGVLGSWYLQTRSHERAMRSALDAVTSEVAFNGVCLEAVVMEGKASYKSLKTGMWDRYGAEMVHALPEDHLRALQILQAEIDQLGHTYELLLDGIQGDRHLITAVKVHLLAWVHRTRYLTKLIKSDRRLKPWRRGWWIRLFDGRTFEDRLSVLLDKINKHSGEQLKALGFQVDENGEVESGPIYADLREYAVSKKGGPTLVDESS